ncbi:unnamed protein product [Cuscuta epithymum]|uniref:Uncharacterized protein n=1 Tax=Cuscuta epithymum TaxID=186058 RepID=A0AAV0CD57_9ASTE|nr:unnamed protein product [Cuscuta epithymum]
MEAALSLLLTSSLILLLHLLPISHPLPSDDQPRLIEKQLKLDYLGESGSPLKNEKSVNLGHYAGYFKLKNTKNARMFYFFFESRENRKSDPVVIWLTGGPGCGSELALFYENGPFHIQRNLSLTSNNYGWDKISNIIFVDQPTGTGFSYSNNSNDTRVNEKGVSKDLYNFLQGFAIGNGLTNPSIQYPAYTDYALEQNLINKTIYDKINRTVPACETSIKSCGTKGGNTCITALGTCLQIFNGILDVTGNINYYDIREKCTGGRLCYDFSNMETYLNLKKVRKALGVGNITYVSCNTDVQIAMERDWMTNLEVDIPSLLEEDITMLIYAGEFDLICNWLGNSRWVHAMKWSGQENFSRAPNVNFTVDGNVKGTLKSHGPLSFLKVSDAGHMVPMDQPEAALVMLQRWMQGKLNSTM